MEANMHDLKAIRDNPRAFAQRMARRGASFDVMAILEADKARRDSLTALQSIRTRQNDATKAVAAARAAGSPTDGVIDAMQVLKTEHRLAEETAKAWETKAEDLFSRIPNAPADDVPEGVDETDNVELRRVGVPGTYPFEPTEHHVLGEALGMMDFERAAVIAGSRFTVLSAGLDRMARALGQFMLDLHVDAHGYRETSVPLLVRDHALMGTGQLPKFGDDLFRTQDGRWLIPTAEVPLTNLVRDMILPDEELPMRLVALTPCFRAEAGAAGRDVRGMLRQHQFEKVELVSVTDAEGAQAEHERMTAAAEEVLKRLGLPYRVVVLCGGDMGFSARRTYDIEVWLPGQKAYREISSCSDCGDFQARRMKARHRPAGGGEARFVHTLNGSGVAVGRCLIAVMENYQEADGSIVVPEVLRPYMGGIERIAR
jgi:seryl-tRNA synthetase